MMNRRRQVNGKLVRLLLASVLAIAAMLSGSPRTASADIAFCLQCQWYGDCIACCRCDGYTIQYCVRNCP